MQLGHSHPVFPYRKVLIESSSTKRGSLEFLFTQTLTMKGKTRSQGSFKVMTKGIRLPPIDTLEERARNTCQTMKLSKSSPKTQVFTQDSKEVFSDPVSRCLFKTIKGTVHGKAKPANEDSFITQSSLLGRGGCYLFAVCDGHGQDGQQVATHIKTHFVRILERLLPRLTPAKALQKTYKKLDKKLEALNVSEFSGSTCVSVLIIGKELYCCNVGDSRAVMVSLDRKNNSLTCQALSNDHTPLIPEEAERIKMMGGRIKPAFSSNQGSLRVWLAEEEVPGLCMTRSIGDKGCKPIGVTSAAEVQKWVLTGSEEFIILASDGIWQFISNEEAATLVLQSPTSNACTALCEEARRRWRLNCESTDDITALVVYLKDFP